MAQRTDASGNSPFFSFNSITPGQDFGGANSNLYRFNTTVFSQTLPLKFGTSGRDIIEVPAWWTAFKTFTFKEGMYLQFRAEAFNAFNNVQFNPPDMSVVSQTFGV